jgi:hypothetical protein
MKKGAFLVVLFISQFLFLGCELTEPAKSDQELLAGGASIQWKVVRGIAKIDGAEIDVVSAQNPCVLDNLLELYANGKFDLTEGTSKCSPNDPQLIYTGNWAYNEATKKLTIDKFTFLSFTIDNPSFAITELTETTFSGTTVVQFQGETVTADITFEKVNN